MEHSVTDVSAKNVPPHAAAVMPSVLVGLIAALAMLAVYFGVLSLVSGWSFTVSEFTQFWPYIVALATGFGIQIGLYVHLRHLLAHHHGGRMLAASGTTSTAAMLSCCTHYLANVLPIIGAAGFVTLVAQYQVQLFWVGLVFNIAGIAYIGSKVVSAGRHT
jgi:Cu+-exporting ATPase